MSERKKTHYETLGVSREASPEVIKAAYRALARRLHPDRTGGDPKKEERLRRVNAAYEVLGDAGRRAAYDERLRLGAEDPESPMAEAPSPYGDGLFRVFLTDDLGRVIERARTEGVRAENLPELAAEFIAAARGVLDQAPARLQDLQRPERLAEVLGTLFRARH